MSRSISIKDSFEKYLAVLSLVGGVSGKAIYTGDSKEIDNIEALDGVSIPSELKAFFELANGYDDDICDELDVLDPEFAWGMYLLSIKDCVNHYQNLSGCGGDENPDYWPAGFLPILWSGGGDYVLVNCIKNSKTFGAVYDMCHGVGCNLMSNSLMDFIDGNRILLEEKIRVFDEPEGSNLTTDVTEFLSRCTQIFGNTPYFQRVGGRMGQQIVDWK